MHVVFDQVTDINGRAELAVKIAKRIGNGNVGPHSFTEQCDPGHPAVAKCPNQRYWPITSTTPTPAQTL